MSARRLALLFPLLAVLLLGSTLTSPAGAVVVPMAATDPVTNLQVTQTQTLGRHDSWSVAASWDSNGAPSYTVSIVPNSNGSGTPYAGPQDTANTSLTLSTTGLLDGQTYYVAVYPTAAGPGAVTTTSFVALNLDRTAPTGNYTVNPTSAYLGYPGGDFFADPTASFTINQTSLSDPGATRKVVLGDGSAPKAWPAGSYFTITYSKAGNFTPHVILTDAYDNVTDAALPTVHVLSDVVGPAVTIKMPASPSRISSWRVVRGTAVDPGTGVVLAAAVVAQKRGGIWYAYNFRKKTWVKGYSRLGKTLNRKAVPAFMEPSASGAWRTPKVRGLRAGRLHVEALGVDQSFNVGNIAKVDRKIH